MVKLLKSITEDPRVKHLGPGLITGAADDDRGRLWYDHQPLLVFLAGSAAYAVSESFDWQSGLDMKVHEAVEFYGIIAIATVGGVALNFTHLDPMRALVWSAEINGVIAVPIMAIMMLLASREDVMGRFVIRPRLRGLGWIATAVMAVTVVAMIATT